MSGVPTGRIDLDGVLDAIRQVGHDDSPLGAVVRISHSPDGSDAYFERARDLPSLMPLLAGLGEGPFQAERTRGDDLALHVGAPPHDLTALVRPVGPALLEELERQERVGTYGPWHLRQAFNTCQSLGLASTPRSTAGDLHRRSTGPWRPRQPTLTPSSIGSTSATSASCPTPMTGPHAGEATTAWTSATM